MKSAIWTKIDRKFICDPMKQYIMLMWNIESWNSEINRLLSDGLYVGLYSCMKLWSVRT